MKHIPLPFWAYFNAQLALAAPPGFLLLGEDLDGNPSVVARTWREGGFTAMFDFPFAFASADVFCRGQSPAKLGAVLSNDRRYPDPSRLVTLLDNHDLPRLMTVCGGDQQKMREALTFLLTMRGIPSLQWGTEVGLDGQQEPDNRKSMRFELSPLRSDISELLAARREAPALSDGASEVLFADVDHLAVRRATADQVAIITVNRASAPWTLGAGLGDGKPLGQGVQVWLSPRRPGAWAALASQMQAQWRTGARKRSVTVTGSGLPEDAVLVGSGEELGDWNLSRGVTLPARLTLPEGGVFEFKLVARPPTGEPQWEPGENRILFVAPGTDPPPLELHWGQR